MNDKRTKITILGTSGAGKTCYLLGMYHIMNMGMKSFYIKADDDTDVELKTKYRKMKDSSLGTNRFPAGTDTNSEYSFMLQYGFEDIVPFQWIDYAGGALVSKTAGDEEEYKKIKDTINESSCLLICVDGELLKGNDTEEKIERVKEHCTSSMHNFFADYFTENQNLPPTAIVLTKYDVCEKDTDLNEIDEVIREAFGDFFPLRSDIERIVAIIPVSLGTNISENNYSGKLKPINIHLPIFMGIWFTLQKLIKEYADALAFLKTETNSYMKMKDKVENIPIPFFSFFNKKTIQELSNRIDKIKNLSQKTKKIFDIMTKHSELLTDELNEIELLYENNKKTSFKKLLEG